MTHGFHGSRIGVPLSAFEEAGIDCPKESVYLLTYFPPGIQQQEGLGFYVGMTEVGEERIQQHFYFSQDSEAGRFIHCVGEEHVKSRCIYYPPSSERHDKRKHMLQRVEAFYIDKFRDNLVNELKPYPTKEEKEEAQDYLNRFWQRHNFPFLY